MERNARVNSYERDLSIIIYSQINCFDPSRFQSIFAYHANILIFHLFDFIFSREKDLISRNPIYLFDPVPS